MQNPEWYSTVVSTSRYGVPVESIEDFGEDRMQLRRYSGLSVSVTSESVHDTHVIRMMHCTSYHYRVQSTDRYSNCTARRRMHARYGGTQVPVH